MAQDDEQTPSAAWDALLDRLRAELGELSPEEALERLNDGVAFIDIREADEVAAGRIAGAQWLSKGLLERDIENLVPDKSQPLVLYCAGGNRSLVAARALRELGYTDVISLAEGFDAWKKLSYPIEQVAMLDPPARALYSRHTRIPEVGEEGQLKLLQAKVLLVGAGGLGSPAALYLAAAGIGTLGIVDFDTVDLSNLHRQVLHGVDRVGAHKIDSATETLRRIGPNTRVVGHRERLTSQNVSEIVGGYDIVLDGTDNFPTRYLVNDACVLHRKPQVHGSIHRFEGQVSVFCVADGPCYRCLYPEPPPPELAPSCAETGVLGVLPGVIGTLMAVEAIKLILDTGDPLVGRLLTYDALAARTDEFAIDRDPNCALCAPGREFPGFIDYESFCAGPG